MAARTRKGLERERVVRLTVRRPVIMDGRSAVWMAADGGGVEALGEAAAELVEDQPDEATKAVEVAGGEG